MNSKPITIVLATRNPSKAEQVQAIFHGSRIVVQTLDQAGIKGEAVENGKTLRLNALKKAAYAWEQTAEKSNLWTMADDTGIFIEALGGKPGVLSARWAGETATTEEILAFTLRQLENQENRFAVFITAVALISPQGEAFFFRGERRGKLLQAPRVSPQPQMPYSPIFVPDGQDKTWAEMTTDEENKISHRGIAFRELLGFFEFSSR